MKEKYAEKKFYNPNGARGSVKAGLAGSLTASSRQLSNSGLAEKAAPVQRSQTVAATPSRAVDPPQPIEKSHSVPANISALTKQPLQPLIDWDAPIAPTPAPAPYPMAFPGMMSYPMQGLLE